MSGNPDDSFASRFLERIGHGRDQRETAQAGKLPDMLTLPELNWLLGDGSDTFNEDTLHALERASESGELQAQLRAVPLREDEKRAKERLRQRRAGRHNPLEAVHGILDADTDPPRYVWIVHRDAARRYFRKLGLEPQPRSPLWCWIHNTNEQAPTAKAASTLRADFEQRCIEHWRQSPTTPVTGENGIGALFEGEFPRARSTLERWARPHAPPEVKARIGRPKNPTS